MLYLSAIKINLYLQNNWDLTKCARSMQNLLQTNEVITKPRVYMDISFQAPVIEFVTCQSVLRYSKVVELPLMI